MASKATWTVMRYFKYDGNDKWGDPDAISDDLLLKLDDLRHYAGFPIHVLHGVKTGGHSKKSFHYLENGACAVDCVMPEWDQTPWDLITFLARFGFTGIGYYPHWRYSGHIVGGFHIDTRPLKKDSDGTLNYRHNRWMGVLENGKQIYKPMTHANLLKYGGQYDGANRLS